MCENSAFNTGDMHVIGITGATGQVGSEVVKLFDAEKGRVMLLVRNCTDARLPQGFQKRPLDFTDPSTFASALEGIERLFLVVPIPDIQNFEQFLRTAKEVGIQQIVMISGMGAERGEAHFLLDVENSIREMQIPLVALRANWFMQNFSSFFSPAITDNHELAFPDGGASISFIDARDLAAVAHHFLVSPTVTEETRVVTGAESLAHADVATLFSNHLPYKVTYRELTEEQARTELGWDSMMLALFKDIRDGLVTPITDTVEKTLERAPCTLEAYIIENLHRWG